MKFFFFIWEFKSQPKYTVAFFLSPVTNGLFLVIGDFQLLARFLISTADEKFNFFFFLELRKN